ncbi:MAG: NAD(P)-binding domain-containing protein [Chloroflexi bacterium]|nr:NAD(P)-binding domain-containing protein [Chloroflexota bacterium]
MRIAMFGAGIIGQAIVKDLADGDDVEEILVGDVDEEAARRAAAAAGPRARAIRVDVTDRRATAEALRGMDVLINAVAYRFNLDVMHACLDAGVHYLDLGGLFHTTRKQLQLDPDFRRAGLTAVLGMGSCPGVANVQTGYLAAHLDTVEYVHIYNGSHPLADDPLNAPYSIETILDEITRPAMVFRDGKFVELPPLSEEEYVLFPEPIGYTKTHLSLHSEVATIPLSLKDKGIREVTFKITFFGYSERALRQLQFLADLGLADLEPVEVPGGRVRPRDVLIAVLRRKTAARAGSSSPDKPVGVKAIITEAQGTRDGQPVRMAITTFAGPHEEWGMSGGKLLVASPPAIVARWLADGTIARAGVYPPEMVVPPEPFFQALAERGAWTRETVESPIA